MKGRSLFVRIVAIFLCAVMVLGVVTAAIYAFAADEAVLYTASPDTGSSSMIWVILALLPGFPCLGLLRRLPLSQDA